MTPHLRGMVNKAVFEPLKPNLCSLVVVECQKTHLVQLGFAFKAWLLVKNQLKLSGHRPAVFQQKHPKLQ